uniref:Uncharacterized protein n=1 Tax=Anguilla anguilla TaxID=7936 RepID=A0A0E9RWB4_ANGAN
MEKIIPSLALTLPCIHLKMTPNGCEVIQFCLLLPLHPSHLTLGTIAM